MKSVPIVEPFRIMSDLIPLNRMTALAHRELAPVLGPGDLAVDLTAGNGFDTLFLHRCVGPAGKVLSFDIQKQALAATAGRLREAGASVADWPGSASGGVLLIHDSHCRLSEYLNEAPQAVVANLGFLPGGDPALTTRPSSTLTAIEKSLELLAPGGRLAVVVYPGHPGGREEGERVSDLFAGLSSRQWNAVCRQVLNRRNAPFIITAEKKRGSGQNR
jgi:hypothetical protein